jgi:hypothetical protein
MQEDRIAVEARLAGTVRGLGVCDALRLELEPAQRAGLEIALAARAAALEGSRAQLEAAARARVLESEAELEHTGHELRLLSRMRTSLPAYAGARFVLTGPAGLVLELVSACLATALAQGHDAVVSVGATTLTCPPELNAAAAWITTANDCGAVEAYCFEPDVDPLLVC